MTYQRRLMNAAAHLYAYPRDRFHADPRERVLSADASDLRIQPGASPFERLWADACDVGLRVAARDGRGFATFYLADQDTDGEDVVRWRLAPTLDTLRCYPALKGWALHVYND